jgi:adenine-specific DNA-methyltransferase
LIRRVLEIATNEDDVILDSFAGSGTTGHAVLDLNKEDGGTRKFILIQIPFETKENENDAFNIARKITVERTRRVVKGYAFESKKGKEQNVEGLGGTFTFGSLGRALFGEYRDMGEKSPPYEELAKYIFYTETSRDFDPKTTNERTGKIGEDKTTSYYLLYSPDGSKDRPLDIAWLKSLGDSEKNRNLVVYCEKLWVHRDDLKRFEDETKRRVRPMLIPFNLK